MCISLPYVETFNSKVIKGFVPELRSRYMFFVFRDSYILCIDVMNILCTFHISVSGYGTLTLRSSRWTLVESEAPKSNNDRLEAVRLPVSAWLPPSGRDALLTLFDKLWFIRLTLHCEQMSSIDQLGLSLGLFTTFPSTYPHFGLLTLCQTLSGGWYWQIESFIPFLRGISPKVIVIRTRLLRSHGPAL